MNEKLDKQLCDKYPLLLKNRHNPKSCFVFGFEVNDGWFWLLDKTFGVIDKYHRESRVLDDKTGNYRLRTNEEYPYIEQVKEKFSSLRIYINNADDHIHSVIEFAEYLSNFICEDCGTLENVSKNKEGWIKTLCVNCRKK